MRKSLLVCMLIGGVGTGAFAQHETPQHEGRANKMHSPEERAEMRSKRMQETLALSNNQYQKILAINLEQEKNREAFHKEQKESMAKNHEKMKANREALMKSYESVLTPEQMGKLHEEAEKRRGEMKGKERSERRKR